MRGLLALTALAAWLATAGSAAAAPPGGKIYQNLIAATNGLLTAHMDPIMQVVYPPDDFEYVWGYPVTARALGLVSGTAMMVYRLTGAVYDIVVAPFWIFPVLSPEPRFEIIPGADYE